MATAVDHWATTALREEKKPDLDPNLSLDVVLGLQSISGRSKDLRDLIACAVGSVAHFFPNFGIVMDWLDPPRAAVALSAGRINRILRRSPRSGRHRLLPSPVNRKARKQGVEQWLIQDAGCAPGLPAHNAGPERGIINTRGQGRAPANNREREDGKGQRG